MSKKTSDNSAKLQRLNQNKGKEDVQKPEEHVNVNGGYKGAI